MARTDSLHRADRPRRQDHLSQERGDRPDRGPQGNCGTDSGGRMPIGRPNESVTTHRHFRVREMGTSPIRWMVALSCSCGLLRRLRPAIETADDRLGQELPHDPRRLSRRRTGFAYLEAYCRPGSTDREWRRDGDSAHGGEARGEQRRQGDSAPRQAGRWRRCRAHDHGGRRTKSIFASWLIIRPTSLRRRTGAACAFGSISSPGRRRPTPRRWCRCMPASAFCLSTASYQRLPTEPWADQARYVPGQVYAAPGVDRNDVNPRPLSTIVPSSGLCGCFSGDEKQIMAVAWEPYQEIFQGVIACIHSDFPPGRPGTRRNEEHSAASCTSCRPMCPSSCSGTSGISPSGSPGNSGEEQKAQQPELQAGDDDRNRQPEPATAAIDQQDRRTGHDGAREFRS